MMNLLAEVMNIKDSEHSMIEDSIRNMNKSSKSGVPLIDDMFRWSDQKLSLGGLVEHQWALEPESQGLFMQGWD